MAQDQKQEAIINAAIKRFAHFGVAKTTMAEIANDLSFSKASLYYYFPDKLSLYAAVVKSITNEVSEMADAELVREKDPFKAIEIYLQRRTDHIIKYHNVLEYLRTFTPANLPAELTPVFKQVKSRELQRIVSILERGIALKLFRIDDARRTAELFFDFLEGFRYTFFMNAGKFFPDKKQFHTILKKELDFATIFLNGLTVEKK